MLSRHTLVLRVFLIGVAIALIVPSVHAQGRGGGGFVGRGARVGGRGRSLRGGRGYYPGWGFLPDDYDSEDESGYEPPAAPPYPPYQVLVAPPAPSAPPAPPVEPLLMENRGGQWVRVPTGAQLPVETQAQTEATSARASSSATPAVAAQPIVKLPPTVIVFRDGHMEEIEKYVLRDDILYTSADYSTTGSLTRQIPLTDLDIPATLKLNQQRGAKFDLPSSPSEIMVRF